MSNLNLSSCDGRQTFTGDELWRKYDPQTLIKAFDFIERVVMKNVKGSSLKKAMQQTFIDYTKPSLIKEGIMEYYLSQTELFDSYSGEGKGNSDNGASVKNTGSNFADLEAYPNAFETKVTVRRKKELISRQPSVKGRNQSWVMGFQLHLPL